MTFVKLNRLWPLSNSPLHPPPLLLKDNIKLDGMPTRLNEKYKPVLHCITGFKRVLLWKLWDTAMSSFISCFTSVCPKMSSEIFLTKSCKRVFYVSPVNCYCAYISKGSNYRYCGLHFRTYFKSSYFDSSINNYL